MKIYNLKTDLLLAVSTVLFVGHLSLTANAQQEIDNSFKTVHSYNDETRDEQAQVFYPSNIDDVKSIVKQALSAGFKIRVSGASHATSGIILSNGIYLNTAKLNQIGPIEEINGETVINIQPGVKLGELSDYLAARGYSIGFAFPAYQDLTVGGLIATGSHGSSRLHTAVSSQTVREATIVNGQGEIVKVSAQNSALFKAAKVSLGTLGVVTSLKIKIEPEFNLQLDTSVLQNETGLLRLNDRVNWGTQGDYEAIAWFPIDDRAIKFTGTKTEKVAQPGAENVTLGGQHSSKLMDYVTKTVLTLGKKFSFLNKIAEDIRFKSLAKSPPFVYQVGGNDISSASVTGSSGKITISRKSDVSGIYSQEDFSFSFPESKAREVLQTIREYSIKNKFRFPMVGIYFRFGHSDGGSYLSHIEQVGHTGELFVMAEFMEIKGVGANSRDVTSRSVQMRIELLKLLSDKFHVGFHWGKNTDQTFRQSNLESVYGENLSSFRQQVRAMDPQGIFQSDFTEELLLKNSGLNLCQRHF